MTPELKEALARWESGVISREELVRRFPDEDVVGLVETVEHMRAAADVATPDAAAAWDALRDHLPARLDDRRRGGAKAIRLLAAAMIAVLLMGATAYALVPSVQRAVDDALHVFIGGADPVRQADTGSDADEPRANTPGENGSATSGGSEGPGDDQSGQDPDGDSDAGSGDDGTTGDGSGSGSDDGGQQGSSADEGMTDGDSGTGSEEAAGSDHGSSAEEDADESSGAVLEE